MKLCRIHIVAPDGGGERLAVRCPGGNNARINRLGKKAVDKINIAAAGNTAKDRTVRFRQFNLVPANRRDVQPRLFAESDDVALEYSQPGGATVERLAL